MFSYLFIALAAMFNSVMDKTKDTIQYNSSLFGKRGWNPKFWNDEVSEHVFIFGTKYKPNAWHISKSCMLICFDAAISTSVLQFYVIGAVWILTFNLFYNKLLKK